jgi:hypothetical protein
MIDINDANAYSYGNPRIYVNILLYIGMDDILNINTSDKNSVETALLMYRINLEKLIVKINHEKDLYGLKVKICICTPTLVGDRYDGSNKQVRIHIYVHLYLYIYI